MSLPWQKRVPWRPEDIKRAFEGARPPLQPKTLIEYLQSLRTYLSEAWTDIAEAVNNPTGERFKITAEGGYAIALTNNTGAVSIKGTAVHASETLDDAVDLANLAGFDTIGFIYNSGVPVGEKVWVVIAGIAEVLLEDGTGSVTGNWCQTSNVQQGRVNAEASVIPGQTIPTSISISVGTNTGGALTDLGQEDGILYTIREVSNTPGIDIQFTVNTSSRQEAVNVVGRYAGTHTVAIQVYNNNTTSWDTIGTMNNSASLQNFNMPISPDHWNSATGNVLIRFYHSAAGNPSHYLYFDVLTTEITSETHFKENGHSIQTVSAGTDKLMRMITHFN